MLNYRKLHHKHMFLVVALSLWVIVACQSETVEVTRGNSGGNAWVDPTPRPRATPTNSVALGFGTFSMSSADQRLPSNIRQEAQFFVGGGTGEGCKDRNTYPYFMYNTDFYEIFPTSTGWATEEIHLVSCGWSSKGYLPVTIYYPNGTSRSARTTVMDAIDGGLEVVFRLDLGSDPDAGEYRVTFEGRTAKLSHSFEVLWPTEPRLYTLSNGNVVLWNFRANETVWLIAYNETNSVLRTAEFVAYQRYVTDEDGLLYVETVGSFDGFVAVGDYTGEVNNFDWLKKILSVYTP